jgi:pyruvate/2-oxoglutarate/acetoin dehydrogenase E1 component
MRDRQQRCVQALNHALREILASNSKALIIGEDLHDPYGGAFKVTKDLSTDFSRQVISTPISESAIFGVACGLALRGYRPIVEVMFGDFLTLGFDQLINHISLFQDVGIKQTTIPLVVRTPMGGGRGYGPTHSKSLEKLVLGIPNIIVVATSRYHDIASMLKYAVALDQPVIFIENKQMYAHLNDYPINGWINQFAVRESAGNFPALTLSPTNFNSARWTIVTYGGSAPMVLEAARQLVLDHEVVCEVVILSSLQPMDIAPVVESVKRTGRLLALEEGIPVAGIVTEIVSQVVSQAWTSLKVAPRRIGSLLVSIPAAPNLEKTVLPQVQDVIDAILGLSGRWE